jgi:adenylate cyclase class 2
MENIEIKYRLSQPDKLTEFLSTYPEIESIWTKTQTDTYYQIPHGRLKLREETSSDGQLIYYQRPDSNNSRISKYEIYVTADARDLNTILSQSLGLRVVVQKVRQLFMYRNVRIHLDQVEKLGSFLELESVIGAEADHQTASINLTEIQKILFNFLSEPVAVSYADLLLSQEKDQ